MSKLRLGPVVEERPVKLTVELSRELLRLVIMNSSKTGDHQYKADKPNWNNVLTR